MNHNHAATRADPTAATRIQIFRRARCALHAEWTKLRTLASTYWLLATAAALTVVASAAVAATARCPLVGCAIDPGRTSLSGVYLGQAVVAIAAVTSIGGEYSTGMIRLTLMTTPRRLTVLGAKAALIAALTLTTGTIGVLGSLIAGRLILPGHGIGPAHGYPTISITDGATARAAFGSVLYLALVALLSLGTAAAVRESAAATGIVLGLLYLIPILAFAVGDANVSRHLQQIGPMTAGLAIQATTDLHTLPIGPWAGLGVLAAWATAALVIGGLLLTGRDA